MPTLPIKKGIDSLPVSNIPSDPAAFITWFKTSFLSRWAALADVRNATPGVGITIDGNISSPAMISASADIQALFSEPYMLATAPPDMFLLNYRTLAAQAGVLALADGGAKGHLTVSVAANGIGNTQLRQAGAASVIGNATAATANVADIAASADNTVLLRAGGSLSFAALPLTAIASVANLTVVGNASGGSAAPTALSQTQLTALIDLATTGASGAMPQLDGNTAHFLNGNGVLTTPAYPTSANPTAKVALAAVNGSAATFMRSDASPALDVTIAPTWTGVHTFQFADSTKGLVINVASAVNGAYLAWQNSGTERGFLGTGPETLAGAALGDFILGADTGTLRLAVGSATALAIANSGAATFSGNVGLNGATPPAKVTGWGTPAGPAVTANFPATPTLAQCGAAIGKIIADLKAFGLYGA